MLKTNRKTDHPVLPIILNRWSSRAFSREPLSDNELMTLFDAARWAQNSFNNQPWRFLYAINGKNLWSDFLNLLVPGNKEWAQHAYALVVVASKKTFDYDGSPSKTHTFDTGAAAQNMALQAASMGIVTHGMEGFDYDKARTVLHIPDDYQVEAMFAIGKFGNSQDDLPPKLREREKASDRKPLKDVVFEGKFSK
jgi:nitroreductase